MRIFPLGDSALMAELGTKPDAATAAAVSRLARSLEASPLRGVQAVVPSFTTVTVYFAAAPEGLVEEVTAWIRRWLAKPAKVARTSARTLTIPVCYGGKYGPDLAEVATQAGLSVAQVIAMHKTALYDVRAIGFTPGFPYLGGLPGRLRTARRKTPRVRVAAGSVGIGGGQTGIYPMESPGGWNLIGRTPLRLFRPEDNPPVLLRCGDRVRFQAITPEEFAARSHAEASRSVTSTFLSATRAGPGMTVVKSGLLTTMQDLGRPGMQAHGIPEGGAMDRLSARVANMLVGNAGGAAVVECTLRGPVVQFSTEVRVAITGARATGLPWGRPFTVSAGETLSLEALECGARAYLAVAGGFGLPAVLGSRSAYLRAGLPGLAGRALQGDDVVPLTAARVKRVKHPSTSWFVSTESFLTPGPMVRVVRGPQVDWFEAPAWRTLQSEAYRLTSQSDRMGLRLQGPPLGREGARELVSEGVAAGSVQVPPDGLPIVLMADRQTLGGYPKIANVISADLPKLAQLRPGESVRFEVVAASEARRLAAKREQALARLRVALAVRFG